MQISHVALAAAFALATAPFANAQAEGAAPAAAEAPATEDAKPAAAEPAKAEPAKAEPAAEAMPEPEAAPEPATPAPTEGSLSVSSNPAGASIWIDDKDTGNKTPAVDLKVAPGTHNLKVVLGDRTKLVTFHLEAGGELNLNLNLPEATPVKKPKPKPVAVADKGEDGAVGDEVVEDVAPWTWMTVAGWAGLGLGAMGLVSGAVVLTTPYDNDQGPLGFGLFGTGAGLVLGGGVLLYLDNELNGEEETTDDEDAEKAASVLPLVPALATR